MALRVLITNIELWPPSGTVIFVRDLALELQRRGHSAAVFSSTSGGVAEELRDAGIEVIDRLERVSWTPDIIHGHHHAPTLIALRRWPSGPAIFVCHDHRSPDDRPPIHPSIRRYFGVSRVCVERLVADGVPEGRADLLLNFVDLVQFAPREPLPAKPRRALVFSNYANDDGYLPAVHAACDTAGLELDAAGAGVGSIVRKPGQLFGQYDIVFAKAKAAMEAMAVGTAVVLCDFDGVGPMVTTAEFDALRPLNFGHAALGNPLQPEALLREINRYDATDAALVRDRLRASASLVAAAERLEQIYETVIEEHRHEEARHRVGTTARPSRRDSLFLRLYWSWRLQPPRRLAALRRIPGVSVVIHAARRVLGQAG